MKRLFLLCVVLLAATVASGQEHFEAADRVGLQLEKLEGVAEITLLRADQFAGKYEVMLTQPLDWHDLQAGTFQQRVVVMHVGYDRPTLVVTQGYDAALALKESYRDELSKLFDTNIVFVEHRYFGRSTPDPCDWRYLTAENSACDLHRIVNLFRQLYPGKWIASGVSKGGTTTMLYAAYFPGDVDVYVPYVGPLCTSREDRRFGPFMAQVGTPQARAAVEAYQTEVLRRREELLPGFEAYCAEKGYAFRLPIEEIFDYCVLEYGFSFWQWGMTTDKIPAVESPDEVLLRHLLTVADPSYFDVQSPLAPFFVQAARELGYYPYDLRPFRRYTAVRSTRDYLRRIFLPEELQRTKFSKKLYRKVARYLKRNDPRMILVYGGDDPWTAPGAAWAATPRKCNMRVFVEPGGSHLTRIATLPDSARREAVATLRSWLEN